MFPLVFIIFIFTNNINGYTNLTIPVFKIPNYHIINNLVKVFHQYNILIHTENITQKAVPVLLKYYFIRSIPVQLINYDLIENPTRPTNIPNKCSNVVMMENPNRVAKFLANSRNLHQSDLFVFHGKNKTLQPYFHVDYIERVRLVIFINYYGGIFTFYNICYECGEMSGKFNYLFSTDIEGENINNYDIFFLGQDNLHGQHFKIGYVNYFPFFVCRNSTRRKKFLCGGTYVQLIKSLSRTMNFTYQFFNAKSFKQLFSNLYEEKVHFALSGISLTAERLDMVPFSRILHWEDNILFYFSNATFLNSARAYANMFSEQFWIGILISLMATSMGFYFVAKFDNSTQIRISFTNCICVRIKIY